MVAYGQISRLRLHAARIRSKPPRRRSSWSRPHLFGCPEGGVIRVDFKHPIRGGGSSSSNRSPRPAEKLFVKSIFKWKIGYFVCFVLWNCWVASDKRHDNNNSCGQLQTVYSKWLRPCRTRLSTLFSKVHGKRNKSAGKKKKPGSGGRAGQKECTVHIMAITHNGTKSCAKGTPCSQTSRTHTAASARAETRPDDTEISQ